MRYNPPAPLVTGPVIRLVPQLVVENQINEIVLDYMAQAPVGTSLATLAAFLSQWRTACESFLTSTQSDDSTLTTYFTGEVAQGLIPTLVTPVSITGQVLEPPLPGTIAGIITKYTALKGQHGRGRSYLMYPPVTFSTPSSDPNKINATGLAAYNALAAAMLAPVIAAGTTWNLCVSTRPDVGALLVSKATVVTNMIVQNTWGTVRRRREGRGV